MATERANDLRAFRDFLDVKLSNGGSDLTPEECLELWEVENQTEEEREETLEAIRRGLADFDAGRTRPAGDVIRDLCRNTTLLTRRDELPY